MPARCGRARSSARPDTPTLVRLAVKTFLDVAVKEKA